MKEKGRKVIATNRKARHNYTILDVYEAGIALVGTEVKSLREGKASLVDAFATVDDGEVWLRSLHIPEYTQARGPTTRRAAPGSCCCTSGRSSTSSARPARQPDSGSPVDVLLRRQGQGGARARQGKQDYDKRQDLARRTAEREVTRELGRRVKGMR